MFLETLQHAECNWGWKYNIEIVCESVRECENGRVRVLYQNYINTNIPPPSPPHYMLPVSKEKKVYWFLPKNSNNNLEPYFIF